MKKLIIEELKSEVQKIVNNGDSFIVYLGNKFGKEIISIKNDKTKEEMLFSVPELLNPYEIAKLIYNTIKEMYPTSEVNFFKHLCSGFGDTIHTDLVLKIDDNSYLFINDKNNLYKDFIEEVQLTDEKDRSEKESNQTDKPILLQKKNEE